MIPRDADPSFLPSPSIRLPKKNGDMIDQEIWRTTCYVGKFQHGRYVGENTIDVQAIDQSLGSLVILKYDFRTPLHTFVALYPLFRTRFRTISSPFFTGLNIKLVRNGYSWVQRGFENRRSKKGMRMDQSSVIMQWQVSSMICSCEKFLKQVKGLAILRHILQILLKIKKYRK